MKRRRMSTECEMDHSYAMPNINDNSNNLLKKIQNVYANQILTDITLVVGGISYPAHRFMLCISSDVFETMLMNTKWSDSDQDVIELQEVPLCVEVFPVFLQYFYTGVITLEHGNIMPMLVLADKYNVQDLIILCVEYMCEHIADAVDRGQLVNWFQYVLSLNQPMILDASYYYKIWQDTESMDFKPPWNKLIKACRNFIKWNLDACVKCFNTFQCDILVGLLKQSDLVVHDEMKLFGYVESWLNYESEEKMLERNNDADAIEELRKTLTEHVMSNIRYAMILPRQMARMLINPIVKKYKHFFMEKMAEAMEYNLIKKEKSSVAEHVLVCTPRLYTCERWGSTFRIRQQVIKTQRPVVKEVISCSNLFDREEESEDKTIWNVQMHLKGVWFGKAVMTGWHGDTELPDVTIKTVRASIKLQIKEEKAKASHFVRVAILVYAFQNNISHVVSVVQKVVLFNKNQSLINIDDFMVYDALNQPTTNNGGSVHINDTNVSYFIYESLKFHIIITPIVPGLTETHVGTRIQHVHF